MNNEHKQIVEKFSQLSDEEKKYLIQNDIIKYYQSILLDINVDFNDIKITNNDIYLQKLKERFYLAINNAIKK
jgi:hypothetical protein